MATDNTMHLQLLFDNRFLPGYAPWLARRLAWLVGVGVLCCLLGLLMVTAAGPAAAEPTGAAQMAPHASLAVDGSGPTLPMCARLPAHSLCMDAESADPTDPATLPTLSLPQPPLNGFADQAAPVALAQATPQPLLRPPRRQG